MKLKVTIDKDRGEEILIFAHERTKLIDEIESLIADDAKELIGYSNGETRKISLPQISCFTVENNKVYASVGKEKLQIKMRLYQVEEIIDKRFVKINQSCIANINQIERFDTSISGTLKVIFKNGVSDYVSRRNLKTVKERFGVK